MWLCCRGNFTPLWIFPQSDLGCQANSHWALPQISSYYYFIKVRAMVSVFDRVSWWEMDTHIISYVLDSTDPSLQTWPTACILWYAVGVEVVSKPAAVTACACGGTTPWTWRVRIADLNILIFAHFSDCRSEGIIFLSKILRSAIWTYHHAFRKQTGANR